MSLADQVRQVLARGRATQHQVEVQLDIPEADAAGRKQVRVTLRNLFNQGELAYSGTPREYWLVEDPKPVKAEKQAKLWRAMCLKTQKGKAFTLLEVVVLAGTGLYYAKRYLRFTTRQGLVVRVGNRSKQALYRVVPGQERSPAPHWNRREEKRMKKGAQAGTPAPLDARPTRTPAPLDARPTGARGLGPGETECLKGVKQILGDMEAVLIAISGEALLLKGFIREMWTATEAAAGGGHGAESGDQ